MTPAHFEVALHILTFSAALHLAPCEIREILHQHLAVFDICEFQTNTMKQCK
jgi:hypothetical protein